MKIENVDFDAGTIFNPASKTKKGRRFIPMSNRVKLILRSRTQGRSEGWVFASVKKGKHIGISLVNRQWVAARAAAGLPKDLVLYCARHDFGSFVLSKTGNLKSVMDIMGHVDIKSAMVYQHHELEAVREVINSRHIQRHTVKTPTS
ncbi:MAG: tyrosine-type recombinase/integrase [Terracidiphilus sp.]|jgi:integrase